jgi:gliding motility-associated-like protein
VENTTPGPATSDKQKNIPKAPVDKDNTGTEISQVTQSTPEMTTGDRGSVPNRSQPATAGPAKPAPTEPKSVTTNNLMPTRQNVASIRASVLTGTAPLSVDFFNAGNGQVLWWNFGEQLPRNSETAPTHIFSAAGAHNIVLAAVNESGKVFFDTLALHVNPLSAIVFAPNVITPNGDGINDDFELKMLHMAYAQVDIYDAGGKKVFGWEGAEGKWTGKNFGGEIMPAGSYYYTVVAIGKDSEKHTSNGMIRLIR